MGFGRVFERGLQGAELGSILGAAFTTIVTTAAVCLTGPIGIGAFAAAAAASAANGVAIGTCIGGAGGAALGAAEEYVESKN